MGVLNEFINKNKDTMKLFIKKIASTPESSSAPSKKKDKDTNTLGIKVCVSSVNGHIFSRGIEVHRFRLFLDLKKDLHLPAAHGRAHQGWNVL